MLKNMIAKLSDLVHGIYFRKDDINFAEPLLDNVATESNVNPMFHLKFICL